MSQPPEYGLFAHRSGGVDLTMMLLTGGVLAEVMAWYDNEAGDAQQMVRYAAETVGDRIGIGV